jgi:hypothetical protein
MRGRRVIEVSVQKTSRQWTWRRDGAVINMIELSLAVVLNRGGCFEGTHIGGSSLKYAAEATREKLEQYLTGPTCETVDASDLKSGGGEGPIAVRVRVSAPALRPKF